MKVSYFAVWDKKALTYGQLFPSHTPGTAERSFAESVANPESPHHKHPSDFALYHVLDIDDETGQVDQVANPPRLLVEASALVS